MADATPQEAPTLEQAEGIACTLTVLVDGATVTLQGKAKRFSTGSEGFTLQGKAEGSDGRRYQVSGNVIRIGSKG